MTAEAKKPAPKRDKGITKYCQIYRCRAQHEPWQLMCGKHWAMVPRETQTKIYQLYRDAKGTREQIDLALKTVVAISDRERAKELALNA